MAQSQVGSVAQFPVGDNKPNDAVDVIGVRIISARAATRRERTQYEGGSR